MPRILHSQAKRSRDLSYGGQAMAELEALGEVLVNQFDRPFTPAELIERAKGCDVVIAEREPAPTAEVFEALTDVRAFMRGCVDIRNVDIGAASKHGILVTHASPGFLSAVSELIIGFMIDFARDMSSSIAAYKAGIEPAISMGRQLHGSTLGIIGYGAIGRHLAGLAKGLGMKVLVSDPYVNEAAAGIELTDPESLYSASDFVACLSIHSPSTENLMNAAVFRAMQPHAIFINVSRGELVDEGALLDALNSGQIAGAALDVGRHADQVPGPNLYCHAKVRCTPHIGGLTPQSVSHQALETVRHCKIVLEGQIPEGALNAEHATRLAKLI